MDEWDYNFDSYESDSNFKPAQWSEFTIYNW